MSPRPCAASASARPPRRTGSRRSALLLDLRGLADAIADENSLDPEAQLESNELDGLLAEWVAQLPDKQREVIERRYGLNGLDVCTLESIAADMQLTRERARQIQIEALNHLRRIIKRGGVTRENLL